MCDSCQILHITKSDYSDDHVTFCLHSAVEKCVVLSILCSVFASHVKKIYSLCGVITCI